MQPCTPVEVVVNPPFNITFDICTDAAVRMIWSRPSVQSGYSLLRYDWELHTNSSYTNRVRFQSSTGDISTFNRYWVRYTTLTPGVTLLRTSAGGGDCSGSNTGVHFELGKCVQFLYGTWGKYLNAYQDPHQYGICGKYPNAYQDPHENAYQELQRPRRCVTGTICQPPRNMTFNRYNASNRAVYFDFNAPLSGGLTRLHYQPQYRRLPSTSWLTTSFTVSATATSWSIIFTNESFTPGRTIEFRLLAICTGDVQSVPSNVVSYTYPGATITPTTISRPSRTSTINEHQDPDAHQRTITPTRTSTIGPSPTSAACPAPTNLRFTRFSNSNVSIRWNGVDVDLPTAFISVSPNPSDEGDDVRLIMRTEYATYWALYWNGALLFDSTGIDGFEQLDYNTLFEDVEYTTGRVDIRLVARNDIGEDEATETWIVNQRADCLAPTNFRRNVAYERSGALDIRSRYTWTVNPVSDSITTGYVFQYRNTTGNSAGSAWLRFSRTRSQTVVTWGSITAREGQTWQFRVITICGDEESAPTIILSQTWAHPPRSPSFNVCTDARVELRWNRPLTRTYFTLLRYEIEFYTDSSYTNQRRSPISSSGDISGSSSWLAWTTSYNAGETAYMRVRVWVSYTGASGEWPSRWVVRQTPAPCRPIPRPYPPYGAPLTRQPPTQFDDRYDSSCNEPTNFDD